MAVIMVMPDEVMFTRPTVPAFAPILQHFRYALDLGLLWNLLPSARFEMKFKDELFLFILATRMAPPVCLVIPFYLIFARLELLGTFTGLTLAHMTALEGWSRMAIFARVVFPLLRSGIVATAVLCFIFAWNEFRFGFMLGARKSRYCRWRSPNSSPASACAGARWGSRNRRAGGGADGGIRAAAAHRPRAHARCGQRVRRGSCIII